MVCGACEKIIERIAERNGAIVKEIDANRGFVSIACGDEKIAGIKNELSRKGFREKTDEGMERGDPERVFAFLGAIANASANVRAEAMLLNYALAGFIASGLALAVAYIVLFSSVPKAPAYVPMLVLAVLTSVAATYSYSNAKCYGKGISCTNGMMAGMVMGMVPGFMAGAIIGATNGMFIGSLAGMAVGIILGVKAGKHCGIMGAMEGVMAGFMSGIMGAMTSAMMFSDHLPEFLFIAFAICGAMIMGMSYLLNRETAKDENRGIGTSMLRFAATSAIFALGMAGLMFFGPKGPLTLI